MQGLLENNQFVTCLEQGGKDRGKDELLGWDILNLQRPWKHPGRDIKGLTI